MQLNTQLERLENVQLLRHLSEEEPAYAFLHTLTQESAYESLLKNQRRHIHRAVAESCEKLYADRLDEFAALLAQHFAEAGDDAKSFEYSFVEEARVLLQELDNAPMLADNLASHSEICQYAGEYHQAIEYAQRAIQIAKSIDNAWVHAYALWVEAFANFEHGDAERGIGMMEEKSNPPRSE